MSVCIGQQLGNYRLVRLLGRGGFAEVYLGEHIHLGTQAAIKVLHTQLTGGDIEQFRTEARIIARLEHPHIVRILDFGVEEKTPFLVMSYAPNGNLRQRHPKGIRLPLETIVSYVKQVADGLQYAHDQRLIHRDIKPENMLLGRRNEVLLSDFGIAAVAHNTSSLKTQDYSGTVPYSAPEQIKGKPCPASDQYALGITVYEWLTGTRPFNGFSQIEIAMQHLSDPPPSLSGKIPTILSDVEQVVLQALAKDPQQRFASMKAFADALEQACQIAPSHQGTLPTETVTPSSQSPQPTAAAMLSHMPLLKPQSDTVSISRRRGFPTRRIVLLIGLAFLVLTGSLGLFSTITLMRAYNSTRTTITAHSNATNTATAPVNATATASAAATATIVVKYPDPYSPPGMLALNDPLSDNSQGYGWGEFTTNSIGGACQFTGGAYHVSQSKAGFEVSCKASTTNFSNFAFEVQMRIIQGDCGGLIFRYDTTNDKNFYQFRVCQDGIYVLSNSYSITLARNSSSAIYTGLNQSNLIAVVANGSTLDLYVNNQRIDSVSDSSYSQGEIGVAAIYITGPTEVVYSNAKVWTL